MKTNSIRLRRKTRIGLALTLFLLFSLVVVSVQAAGLGIGQPFIIAEGINAASPPAVAVAHNTNRQQFLVAFELGNGGFSLSLRNANGGLAWSPPVAVLNLGENPALAYNSARDEYLLVWQEKVGSWYDIKGVRLSHDGRTGLGDVFDISTRPFDQRKPSVAYNPHSSYQDYLVVWEDLDTSWVPSHDQIWAQRVAGPQNGGSGGGQLLGNNFAVATTPGFWHTEPDVAHNLNMNEFMVVYTCQPDTGGQTDIYNRRITAGGVLLAENPVDSSANDQIHPAVATYRLNHNTPYFVVFEDYWNDTAGDVRGYLVDKQGMSSSLVNVATVGGRAERQPDLSSSEGLGYTVVWSQFSNDWNIYTRRVSDTGGLQTAVSISVPDGYVLVGNDEQNPAVAGGSPVAMVVWEGIFSSIYDIGARMLGYQIGLPQVVGDK
jgi:hypothetical protein